MTINEFNALPLEEREKLIADPESEIWKACGCGCGARKLALVRANLEDANLVRANLVRANLGGANLEDANLVRANLGGAKYSLLAVLQINMGKIADPLTLELMRWDALACGEEAMTAWAQDDGPCPFNHDVREFHFCEKKSLWSPGAPTMTYRELFLRLCEEKEIKHSRGDK